MDKTTLSKHRWIYEMYINEKNEVHIERYKVIYINKKYVFYIRGGDDSLSSCSLVYVFDNMDTYDQHSRLERFLETAYQRVLLWERPAETTYAQLRQRIKNEAMKKLIDQKEAEMRLLQTKQEVLQKEIDALKNSTISKGESL